MFPYWRQHFPAPRYRVLVLLGLLALTALPREAAAQQPLGRSVTLYEYGIALDAASAPAGDVLFSVRNSGRFTHLLSVIKSDLPADGLPSVNGMVDETKAPPIRRIVLNPDTSSVLTTNLAAGRHLLVCTRSRTATTGHYSSGMVIALNVGAAAPGALAAPSFPPVPAPAAPVAAVAPAQATAARPSRCRRPGRPVLPAARARQWRRLRC